MENRDFGKGSMLNRIGSFKSYLVQRAFDVFHPKLKEIEWIGNVFLMFGAVLLSLSPTLAKTGWWIFALMLFGQIFWLMSGFVLRKNTIIANACFFSIINIIAVIIRL